MLLAAYDTRRPTRDIDLQATNLAGDADTVLGLVLDIAAVPQGRRSGLRREQCHGRSHPGRGGVVRGARQAHRSLVARASRSTLTSTLGRTR
ncbi:MAG: hypothetical protein ABI899_05140 [Actinomycetota bacterium]